MNFLQKPRGVKDWFGDELVYFNWIVKKIRSLAFNWGFSEVKTPLFENAQLFQRSNANADIVQKELYQFFDKSQRELALRPEATTPIVRLACENKLMQEANFPLKLFCIGSMYRYERPQNNRFREHWQFSCEVFGFSNLFIFLDTLLFANSLLEALGITGYVLKINNLANFETLSKWNKALKDYLTPYKLELTELSQKRLEKNPLRILDDKIDQKKSFFKNAPKITDFLDASAKQDSELLKTQLKKHNISFEWTDNLVRGLDYYTGFVFEYVKNQDTILAGGVYDNLVEELSSNPTPALGFACGIERLINCLETDKKAFILNTKPKQMLVICLFEEALEELIWLAKLWREYNQVTVYPKVIKVNNGIRLANRLGYTFIGIVGKTDFDKKAITIKNLVSKQQTIHTWNELGERKVF